MKKLLSVILSLAMVFSFSFTAFAVEIHDEVNTYLPIAENTSFIINNEQQARVPNAIPIDVIAKVDGTGVKVHVGNIGVDGLDNVTVTATATGYSSSKTQSGYVPPAIGKDFDFNFPYIKCDTTYNVTIKVVDGSGTITRTGTATLKWSEDKLKNAHWHPGSFSSRANSVEYHLKTHGHEVGATNLVQYLNFANNYRDDVLYDLNRGDTSDYKITTSSTPTPCKKYKSISNGQYIHLANSDTFIVSYGL